MRSQRLPTSGRGFNRVAVQEALTHAVNRWKCIVPKEYPNGAVVFCSEELAEIWHPPVPLKGRIYDCGSQFKTSVIQNAIDTQMGPAYGLLVIDGSDAAFGKVQGLGISMATGPVVSELGHLDAHIAGRTRRGGQSALRYSRLRDGSELAFLRKVAERAAALFTDVHGIIIGGKADMKHKLIAELSERLQKQVVCTVDLSCDAGSEALRQAALRAAGSVASAEHSSVDKELRRFFDLTMKVSMCCYGEEHTLQALEMGAVEHLLLSVDLKTTLPVDDWKALAELYSTDVVEIHPRTELASRFCQSFGIGGCLRWPLDLQVGEDEKEKDEKPQEESPKQQDEKSREESPNEVDCESISTADTMLDMHISQHRRSTLAWLESELQGILCDQSAAEAVTACIEVVLSDDVTPHDEIMENITSVITAEGAPEELALELMRRW